MLCMFPMWDNCASPHFYITTNNHFTTWGVFNLHGGALIRVRPKQVSWSPSQTLLSAYILPLLLVARVLGSFFFAATRVEIQLGIFIDPDSYLGSRVRYSRHYSNGEGQWCDLRRSSHSINKRRKGQTTHNSKKINVNK